MPTETVLLLLALLQLCLLLGALLTLRHVVRAVLNLVGAVMALASMLSFLAHWARQHAPEGEGEAPDDAESV